MHPTDNDPPEPPEQATPEPPTDEEAQHQAWMRVMRHLPELTRIARAMARVDKRINPEDMLSDAIVDILDADPRLYRPERGPWLSFARTRIWKTRTYAIRRIQEHETRSRARIGPQSEEDPALDLPVPVGSAAHQDRMEAACALRQVIDRASDDEREALEVALYGYNPRLVDGPKRLRELLASIGAEVQDE